MPGTEVDVFVAEPFDFDATYARAIRAPLEGTTVSVVSLDDLLALKRSAHDSAFPTVVALEAHLTKLA
jgi:hypothetical protein